jgi:hypothetical protein
MQHMKPDKARVRSRSSTAGSTRSFDIADYYAASIDTKSVPLVGKREANPSRRVTESTKFPQTPSTEPNLALAAKINGSVAHHW